MPTNKNIRAKAREAKPTIIPRFYLEEPTTAPKSRRMSHGSDHTKHIVP